MSALTSLPSPRPLTGYNPLFVTDPSPPPTQRARSWRSFVLPALLAASLLVALVALRTFVTSAPDCLAGSTHAAGWTTLVCGAHASAAQAAALLAGWWTHAVPVADVMAWPNVYGGLAEPRILLRRCSGSMFAPPLQDDDVVGRGVVGVWARSLLDLQLCDGSSDNPPTLFMVPVKPLAPLNSSSTPDGGPDGHADGAGQMGEATRFPLELATSRALVAAQGSIQVAWTSTGRVLLGQGLTAQLEGAEPCLDLPGVTLARTDGGWYLALATNGSDFSLRHTRVNWQAACLAAAQDVAAPQQHAARLALAVQEARSALQDVPRLVGLPQGAPQDLVRFVRKLNDLQQVNTAPTWSTPDRLPHQYQWLWDTCFHALGLNLVNHTLAWRQLQGLMACQHGNGFVPHMCHTPKAKESSLTQPPLLAWATWDNYQFARDKARLAWMVPRLKKYYSWMAKHRSRDGGVTFFYVHGFESGMDNSPRFDALLSALRTDERPDCVLCSPHAASIDLCALMAREMALLGRMLEELGEAKEAALWRSRAAAVARHMHREGWSAGLGFYTDVVQGLMGASREHSDLVSVAGLMAVVAGPMPPQRLEGVFRHLGDSFNTSVPLPSVSRHSRTFGTDMWRGPMWVNMNYMVARGLLEQGRAEVAARIMQRTVDVVKYWYERTGTVFEYYDASGVTPPTDLYRKEEPGMGGVRDYHWTAALTLRMVAELQQGWAAFPPPLEAARDWGALAAPRGPGV